jgi:hypothetical protein
MTDVAVARPAVPGTVRLLDVTAKVALLLLLAGALVQPAAAQLDDKAPALRALSYSLFSFTVPALWLVLRRPRADFPWRADLLVTLPCFSDVLGNWMDLYDSVAWFDDVVHLVNTGLLTAAVLLLTTGGSGLAALLERAMAFGATAAVGWELAEYFALLPGSAQLPNAYVDTLGDLALGILGSALSAVVVWRLRAQPRARCSR